MEERLWGGGGGGAGSGPGRKFFLFVQEMKPLLRRSSEGKQDWCSFRFVSRERERDRERKRKRKRRPRLLRGFLPCSSEIPILMRPRLFVPRTSTPRRPASFLHRPRSRITLLTNQISTPVSETSTLFCHYLLGFYHLPSSRSQFQ